jgi:hypothetical protein
MQNLMDNVEKVLKSDIRIYADGKLILLTTI